MRAERTIITAVVAPTGWDTETVRQYARYRLREADPGARVRWPMRTELFELDRHPNHTTTWRVTHIVAQIGD